jgi:hypothetical protein
LLRNAAQSLSETYPDTDSAKLLERLTFVFATQDNVCLILKDTDGVGAAAYRIPWAGREAKQQDAATGDARDARDASEQDLAQELSRFVESIYKGDTAQEYAAFDKSPLFLMYVSTRPQ